MVPMRTLVGLVGLAGCAFSPGRFAGTQGDDGGTEGDAALSDGPVGDGSSQSDAMMMVDAAAASICNPSDGTLRACYQFDDNGDDGSSNNNDAALTGMSFVAGRRGQALVTTSGTAIVGTTSSLNVSAFTIDMWIRPSVLPTGGARMGLLDSGGRYRVFLQSDGAIRCAVTAGPTLTTNTGLITTNTWQRVTCTYNAVEMRIYINGNSITLLNSTQAIPTVTGGMVIGHNNPTGENFNGAIDDLRVFSAIVPP
jgi:Concanavalin A-like lectin/glucanases superfamily